MRKGDSSLNMLIVGGDPGARRRLLRAADLQRQAAPSHRQGDACRCRRPGQAEAGVGPRPRGRPPPRAASSRPAARCASARKGRRDRPRPHALGDPRPAERPQRPSRTRTAPGDITVIHNGIIENFRELRDGLEARGHTLTSGDRHRGDRPPRRGGLRRATSPTPSGRRCASSTGAYALVVMHRGESDRLVGAREDVPLVVGPRRRARASSPSTSRRSSPTRTGSSSSRRATSPTSGRSGVDDHRRRRRRRASAPVTTIDWSPEAAEKGGYEHFMLKEIHEQPEALRQSITGRVDARRPDPRRGAEPVSRRRSGRVTRIELVACGTRLLRVARRGAPRSRTGPGCRPARPSAPSSATARRRSTSRRSSSPSPSRARPPTRSPRPGSPASGAARSSRSPTPSARRSPARPTRSCSCRPARRSRSRPRRRSSPRSRRWSCSPRRSPRLRGTLADADGAELARRAARPAGSRRSRALDAAAPTTPDLARRYVNSRGFMFVGRGCDATRRRLEGALKLKEVSYVHAEGYAAGELKHGPISLLDAECPLVAVATRSSVYDKLISNVMEGRARDARVIAVATEGDAADRALRRRRLLGPRHPRGAQPGAGDHPAPAVRLPRGDRPRHGRRPAAQPGQVGHGRVGAMASATRPTARGRRRSRPAGHAPELGIDIIKVDRIRGGARQVRARGSRGAC